MKKLIALVLSLVMALSLCAPAWGATATVNSEAELQAAFTAGNDVVLGADFSVTSTPTVPKGVTIKLDLNGHKLSADNTTYAINNLGNLTIVDTKGEGSVEARGIYNGYDADGAYVTTAKIVVESGTFNATGTNGGAAIFSYGVAEIKGGTFTSVGGYSLNNREGATMTVDTAVVTGGIYNNGALTISNGQIATNRGGYTHAIYSSGGSLEIYNGTFSGNGNEVINANSDVAIINGGTFQKVEKTSYLMAGSNMVINGGTFLAHESNPAGHPVRPDVTVKGGTFNYKHTNIAEGYDITDNGDGTWTVSMTQDGFAALIANGGEITLPAGNYTMPDGSDVSLSGKTLTIKGTRDTVIDTAVVKMNDQYVTGANLTFEGVTLNFGKVNYEGFANTASLTYKDCAINGLQFVCGTGKVVFEDCDLNSNGAEHSLWTWGISDISFTGCDFTYGDRAVNCYAEHGQTTNATFTDCTFTKVAGATTTGAIETNSSLMTALNLTITDCTVNEGDLWWVSTWDGKQGANTKATVYYTVTYNANGGTGDMHPVLVEAGPKYALPECTFTAPANKQFKGWATSVNGTVITEETVAVTAPTTFYAIWESVPVYYPVVTPTTPSTDTTTDTSTETKPTETPSQSTESTETTAPTVEVTVPVSGEENTVHVEASVSGTTATVDTVDMSHLNEVIGEHVETGTVTIDFAHLTGSAETEEGTVEPAHIDTVEIPAEVVKEIAEAVADPANDAESLEIVLNDGMSIEFDAAALAEKAAQASGADITISIKPTASVPQLLSAAQQETIGNNKAFDISVTSGGEHISDMGGKIVIHAPYELAEGETAEGIVVYYVDDAGNREKCVTSYDSVKQRVNWETNHLSVYMIVHEDVAADDGAADDGAADSETPAADAESGSPVLWIVIAVVVIIALIVAVVVSKKRKN